MLLVNLLIKSFGLDGSSYLGSVYGMACSVGCNVSDYNNRPRRSPWSRVMVNGRGGCSYLASAPYI
jgi:hypothetical protein